MKKVLIHRGCWFMYKISQSVPCHTCFLQNKQKLLVSTLAPVVVLTRPQLPRESWGRGANGDPELSCREGISCFLAPLRPEPEEIRSHSSKGDAFQERKENLRLSQWSLLAEGREGGEVTQHLPVPQRHRWHRGVMHRKLVIQQCNRVIQSLDSKHLLEVSY